MVTVQLQCLINLLTPCNLQICHQVSHGIQALFGPNDFILGSHVQSLCDALDIPHLEARPDIDNSYKESSLNLQPSQDIMNQAYKVRQKTDI